jgi:NAD(P)-dependent dehydrogenase (short-subunit alcohol dehydrogenase family)
MKTESMEYYKIQNPHYYKDKGIIITGATGGIGSLLTSTLLELGAKIVVVVKNEKKLKEMFGKNIEDGTLQYKIIDFTTEIDYPNKFSDIMMKLGGKLDVMFLCHGQFSQSELLNVTVKEFDTFISVNSRSVMTMISLATPFLKYTKGNIVAISSLESFIPVKNSFLNTTSKCIVNSLIQNAALELASFGVRVNGVAPGITKTDLRLEEFDEPKDKNNIMYIKKKGYNNLLCQNPIEPDEVVDAMLFLGCDDAGFVTGEIIKIDSGYGLNHDNCFSNPK